MPQTDIVQLPARPGAAHSLAEIEKLAEAVARSGMFGIKTKEQAMVLMAISQAEGRHPALAARDYHIIQGQPAKTAVAMQRDFLEAGGKIKWNEVSDTVAEAAFTHPQGGSVTIRWDMQQAERAGLRGKDMWKKYPRQMLRSRVVSEGVRTIFPAATSGMYVPEEARDFALADTAGGTTVDATADTAGVLAEFAAGGDTEPPPERDILAEARSASLRGVDAFRDFWVGLSSPERNSIKSHLSEFEAAAKQADDPFGLPPTQTDLLHKPPEEQTR